MRGGGWGTVLVKKSDGPARLSRACVSLLKWPKILKLDPPFNV